MSFYEFEKFTCKWHKERDIAAAIKIVRSIFDKGYSVMDILDSYFNFIKITPLLDEFEKYRCIKIVCAYISRFHTQHEDEIELIFLTHDLMNNNIQASPWGENEIDYVLCACLAPGTTLHLAPNPEEVQDTK